MTQRRPATSRRIALFIGVAAVFLWAISRPVTVRQGVDYVVSPRRLPLYLKALQFIDRDCQYRLLAQEITGERSSPRDRIVALFEWTRTHVRPTPRGWPVIDDHILHIIIRGYGQDDQMADVFTTLATYAGMPAFWRVARPAQDTGELILSFARVEGQWAMFDVANGLVFADGEGRLADIRLLLERPALVQAIAATRAPGGIPYSQYVESLRPFRIPSMLRAQKQMPLPRLAFELRKILHTPSHREYAASP